MNADRSTLGARVSGRRAGQRFDAVHGVVTEALLFLGDLDPEAIGPNIEHATHYEPTPVGDLERLLQHVPFALERATFVDLGAGMGRAVFAAARFPFRQVLGVEISPALVAIARDNVKNFMRAASNVGASGADGAKETQPVLRCRDVRIVRGDAATFRFPQGPLVVYLYNPFDAVLLARVTTRLAREQRSELAVLYHTPVERAVLEEHPAFELVAEEPFGVAYVRVGEAAP
jgi:SAM-dependent methyltransferase